MKRRGLLELNEKNGGEDATIRSKLDEFLNEFILTYCANKGKKQGKKGKEKREKRGKRL